VNVEHRGFHPDLLPARRHGLRFVALVHGNEACGCTNGGNAGRRIVTCDRVLLGWCCGVCHSTGELAKNDAICEGMSSSRMKHRRSRARILPCARPRLYGCWRSRPARTRPRTDTALSSPDRTSGTHRGMHGAGAPPPSRCACRNCGGDAEHRWLPFSLERRTKTRRATLGSLPHRVASRRRSRDGGLAEACMTSMSVALARRRSRGHSRRRPRDWIATANQ